MRLCTQRRWEVEHEKHKQVGIRRYDRSHANTSCTDSWHRYVCDMSASVLIYVVLHVFGVGGYLCACVVRPKVDMGVLRSDTGPLAEPRACLFQPVWPVSLLLTCWGLQVGSHSPGYVFSPKSKLWSPYSPLQVFHPLSCLNSPFVLFLR